MWESVLSFYFVRSGDGTQVIRLHSKHLSMRYLTNPILNAFRYGFPLIVVEMVSLRDEEKQERETGVCGSLKARCCAGMEGRCPWGGDLRSQEGEYHSLRASQVAHSVWVMD